MQYLLVCNLSELLNKTTQVELKVTGSVPTTCCDSSSKNGADKSAEPSRQNACDLHDRPDSLKIRSPFEPSDVSSPHIDQVLLSGSGSWLAEGYGMVVVGDKCGYKELEAANLTVERLKVPKH